MSVGMEGRVGVKRTFLIGLAATVIGGIGLFLGGATGMSFGNTVMGVGGGLIAAVVPLGAPLARLGGLVIGLLLGVFFTAMELGLLPGGASVVGSGIALVIVLLAITLISGFTSGRISAWSLLLGTVTFVAVFLPVVESAPWTAAQQLTGSFFTLLAMTAIGFITVIPAQLLTQRPGPVASPPLPDATPPAASGPPDTSGDAVASLGQIMGGAK